MPEQAEVGQHVLEVRPGHAGDDEAERGVARTAGMLELRLQHVRRMIRLIPSSRAASIVLAKRSGIFSSCCHVRGGRSTLLEVDLRGLQRDLAAWC